MKLKELRIAKAHTVKEDLSIQGVAKHLKKEKSRHVVVINKDKEPVGIISSVDIVNKIVAAGKDTKKANAKDAMTKSIVKCDSKEDIRHAYFAMVKRNVVFCPVTENKKLKGIVTLQQILKHLVNVKFR